MKRYTVRLFYNTYCDIDVVAKNEAEAIEIAYQTDSGSQLVDNLEECSDPECEMNGVVVDSALSDIIKKQAEEIANMLEEIGDTEFDLYDRVIVLADGKPYEIGGISYHKAYINEKEWTPSICLWVDDKVFFTPQQVSSDLTPILEEVKETCRRIEEDE